MTDDVQEPAVQPTMAVIGLIESVAPIDKADRLESARVDCGPHGSWQAVVVKNDFQVGHRCVVFLPDALLPDDEPVFAFMQSKRYRVRLARLRGAPSEVLVMPMGTMIQVANAKFQASRAATEDHRDTMADYGSPWDYLAGASAGHDVTNIFGVTKYEKKLSATMAGKAKGSLPAFIKKTDEINYQTARRIMGALMKTRAYITVKCDGSSFTAYKTAEASGICSRNLDLKEEGGGAFWEAARKYHLPDCLPEGFALQAELVGPGIQGNPMGLESLELRAFDLIDLVRGREAYLSLDELRSFCARQHTIPLAPIVFEDVNMESLSVEELQRMSDAMKYANGKPAEGIVIRSMDPHARTFSGERLSVKVISLNYKESE